MVTGSLEKGGAGDPGAKFWCGTIVVWGRGLEYVLCGCTSNKQQPLCSADSFGFKALVELLSIAL